MIALHERLSEFSYGYGVTREIERLLAGIGVKAVPFLPNLLDEAELGFDVGFNNRGVALLVQFKLGQSLTRFVRSSRASPVPILIRPFWRFTIDTAEQEGQYETLLKAEQDGAEAYYAAPRFVDWSEYLSAFEVEQVLARSLLIRPSEIRGRLVAQGVPDGSHRIVYDHHHTYVCSEPVAAARVSREELGERIREKISASSEPLAVAVRRIFAGFKERHLVRREVDRPIRTSDDAEYQLPTESKGSPVRGTEATRQIRLEQLRARAKSEDDAVGVALGIEAWSLGIQMILVTDG